MSIFNWDTTIGEKKKPSVSGGIFNWNDVSQSDNQSNLDDSQIVQKAVDAITPPKDKPLPTKTQSVGNFFSNFAKGDFKGVVDATLGIFGKAKVDGVIGSVANYKPGQSMEFRVQDFPKDEKGVNDLVASLDAQSQALDENKKALELMSQNIDSSNPDSIAEFNQEVDAHNENITKFQSDVANAQKQLGLYTLFNKDSGRESLGLSQEHQLEKGVTLALLGFGLLSGVSEVGIALGAGEKIVPMLVNGIKNGVIGIGTFKALDKATEGLKENATDNQRLLLFAGELFAAGGILHGLNKTAPKIGDALFKTITEKYNAPKTIYFDPKEIAQKIATVPESPEHKALIEALSEDGSVSKEKASAAMKNGVTIEIPATVIKTVAEKPIWTKVKNAFGVKSETGESTKTLGKGKTAPQEHNLLTGSTSEAMTPEGIQQIANEVKTGTTTPTVTISKTDIENIASQFKGPEIVPVENKDIKTSDEIVKYVDSVDRTLDNEYTREKDRGILPFTEKQIKGSDHYELQTINIDDLIKNDPDLKDYIDANEQRYEGEREHFNLENPIVIGKNGEVFDGMNRILTLKNQGATEIKAYVPITLDSSGKPIDNGGYGTDKTDVQRLFRNGKESPEGNESFRQGNGERAPDANNNTLFSRKISEDLRGTSERSPGYDIYSEKIARGEVVEINDLTFEVLKVGGFSEPLITNLKSVFEKGGVKKISVTTKVRVKFEGIEIDVYDFDASFLADDNSLYLNPDRMDLPSYEDGVVIDHEINGHSWYINSLNDAGRKEFYTDLKSKADTLKKSWQDVKLSHDYYWEKTKLDLFHAIEKVSSESVASNLLESLNLKLNEEVSLDTFVTRSLNLNKIIDSINTELTRQGFNPISMKAENTSAIIEHNAVIAENAKNLTGDNTSIIGQYILDIQNGTLKFGEHGRSSLSQNVAFRISENNEDITKRIHELRAQLEEAQRNLDTAVADSDIFGDEIPGLQEKVNDLRKQIKDIKYPSAKTPREILRAAETYAGVEPVSISDTEQETINEEYTKLLETEDKNIALEVKEIRESRLTKDEQQNEIDQLKLQNELSKEIMKDMPGKKLQKFISRKEGEFMDLQDPDTAKTQKQRQAIIDRNTTILKASEAAFEATGKGSSMFDDPDTIRNAIAEYRQRRTEYLEQKDYLSKKIERYREKKNIIEAVEKQIRAEGRSRMHQINVIKDFFNLTDGEMKKILFGNPDLRLISEEKFKDLLKGIEGKAYAVAQHREALLAVEYTIFDKELRKVDNLRQAMKMRELKNMSVSELDQFNALLETFQTGDEFLGKRQIQTAKLTDLGEIKTKREALEALAKEAGVPIEEVMKVKVETIDKFLYDVAFARQNPLYKVMVDSANKAMVEAGQRYFEVKNETEKLMREARKSRPRRLVDKLVPTDQMIFDYLEGDDLTKVEIAKRMTVQEIKAALYIQNQYAIVRDYLVNQGTLEKYRQNYITHVRRSFLEMLKETGKGVFTKMGLKGIFKELMDVNKLQRANFNILNDKTGEVLPLEKFFKFSMQRSGNLVPSKNVAKAFLAYMKTFETKRQLDSFIPKIDIFSHVLTPSEMTKRGLIKNDTLRVFVRKWLNTKKGRVIDTGFISPGDKVDLALRVGVALTRMLDLGLNIPVGLASNLGAQTASFIPLGAKKYTIGVARSLTKTGTQIARKYESLIGESFWSKLKDASKDIGDKTNEILFGLYADADRRAKKVFLLGSMTPAEYSSGEVSMERLADLRNQMGRFHIIDGMSSIIGKTAPGAVFTQYKSWAVPLMHTTLSDIAKVIKDIRSGVNPFKSQEGKETVRIVITTSILLLLGFSAYKNLQSKKNRSFLEQLAYKSMNDALSLVGALDPKFWTNPTRLQKFLSDMATSLSNIALSLATGTRTNVGEVKGASSLGSTIEPKAFQQLLGSNKQSTEESITDTIKKSLKTTQDKLDQVDPSVYDRVEKIHEQAKELGFGTPEADALVAEDQISDDDYAVYKLFRAVDTKENQLELIPKVLPVFEQAAELGFGTEEADALVSDLTNEEYDLYKLMKKNQYANPEVGPSKWDQQTFLMHVENIAKGWTLSPVTAFDNLVHGDWKITQLKNGQIIVDRMPLDASQEVKAKVAKDNANFKLDHIIPLEVGGTNRADNLQIISTEEWANNSEVENYLGKALAEKKITGKQAREYAIRFKAGQNEVLSPKLLEEYQDTYGGIPITFDEIKNLIK